MPLSADQAIAQVQAHIQAETLTLDVFKNIANQVSVSSSGTTTSLWHDFASGEMNVTYGGGLNDLIEVGRRVS